MVRFVFFVCVPVMLFKVDRYQRNQSQKPLYVLTEPCARIQTCDIHFNVIAFLLRNGIERLRAGLGVLHSTDGIRYEPRSVTAFPVSLLTARCGQ